MKQLFFTSIGFVLLATFAVADDSENERTIFKVDKENSKVFWAAAKVTGEHSGTILLENGEVVVEGNSIIYADISLDMNSITVTDLTNPQSNSRLVNHLKSDDFFSVDQHPQSHFKTTTFMESTTDGDYDYMVTGNLTIKGITHEVSFPVVAQIENNSLIATGTTKLDRTKWDIKYRSGLFFKDLGDKLIYDEFEIKFDLVAKTETVN